MATIDPNQLIQNNQTAIDAATAALVAKQKAAPTVEAQLRQATMGNDAGLNSLRSDYSNGVLQLFQYDQDKAKSYLSPEMQAAGQVADPNVAWAAKATKYGDIAKTTQDVWQQLDARKTVLGNTVKSAMDLYNAELEGDKTLIDTAQKNLATSLQQYQFQTTEDRLNKAAGIDTSASGKQTTKFINMATDDVKKGSTLTDLINTYANTLTLPDILDVYDSNNKWGPRTESNAKALDIYTKAQKGTTATEDPFAGQTANQAMANKVAAQPYATMVGQLEQLKSDIANDKYQGTPGKNLLNPIFGMGLGDPQDVKMHNILSNINNRIIYLRSGKQINESEYKRLESTMANIGTLKGSNLDRINLLLSEFYDTLGAYGINKNNIGTVFPNAATNIQNATSNTSSAGGFTLTGKTKQ